MLLRDLYTSGERLLAALESADPRAMARCLEERADLRERVQHAGSFASQPGYDEWGARIVEQHRMVDHALAESLLAVERRQIELERAESAQQRYAPSRRSGVLREGLAA
jgi:hypothetical protein